VTDGHLAVLEVDHVARVGEDRAHVAGHEVLAVADADEQRAALARRDDLVGSRPCITAMPYVPSTRCSASITASSRLPS
jgi:hypothetical protein